MVPKKGLEPPHPCGYMDLNHARLPIPPLRLIVAGSQCCPTSAIKPGRKYSFIFAERAKPVKHRGIAAPAYTVALHMPITLDEILAARRRDVAQAKAGADLTALRR